MQSWLFGYFAYSIYCKKEKSSMGYLDKGIYVFCDKDISSYEMTIYTLAMAYAESPLFSLDSAMVSDLVKLLNVDEELLKHALSGNTSFRYRDVHIKFGEKIVDCTDCFESTFFASIIKLHLAYKDLYKISDGVDGTAIKENIRLMQSVISFFESINANNATYECMLEQRFSYKHTVYDSGGFPPIDYLKMLTMLTVCDDCLEYDKSLIPIISHLAQYELRIRLNALYMITIIQIIMHSPFFDVEIQKMAAEMYEHLMFILKNGRIISIQVNSLFFDSDKSCDDRTKRDNTTRLQILYGYENFDAYVMRIDLSHQGQPFVHFNNASPGKVCSYLFNKEEYENTISHYPLLKSCFIEYNNDRWALKERINCKLTGEMVRMFDAVEAEMTHKGVFSENFTEDCVVRFIELFANLLPLTCYTPIDKDGEHARRCFNYDSLVRNTSLLYLAYIDKRSEDFDLIKKDIFAKAIKYGLITNEEIDEHDLLFLIYYILFMAKEKANVTP